MPSSRIRRRSLSLWCSTTKGPGADSSKRYSLPSPQTPNETSHQQRSHRACVAIPGAVMRPGINKIVSRTVRSLTCPGFAACRSGGGDDACPSSTTSAPPRRRRHIACDKSVSRPTRLLKSRGLTAARRGGRLSLAAAAATT